MKAHTCTHTYTERPTQVTTNRVELQIKNTYYCPHIQFFSQAFTKLVRVLHSVQGLVQSDINVRKCTTDSVHYQLLKKNSRKCIQTRHNYYLKEMQQTFQTQLHTAKLNFTCATSCVATFGQRYLKQYNFNLIMLNFHIKIIKPPSYSDKLSFVAISIAQCQQHATTASANHSQTCHVTQTNNS